MQRDPDDGRTELRIAIAGPVVSLALAAVFWLLAAVAPAAPATRSVARYLALINLILAVFNLVPAFPLDGGRLVRGLLWPRVGKARATRLAAGAGSFLAFLLMGLGVLELLAGRGIDGVWYVLLGWFLQEAAAGASRGAQLDEALLGVQVRDAMVTDVATIPAHLSLADAAHQHFLHTGYGGYPVVRGDAVVGLLCLRDVLRHPADERDSVSVQAAMAPITDALVAAPDEPLRSAFSRMAERGVGRLLVMDGGRLVGMLPMSAIVRQLRVRQQLGS
jgi:CBS domain-containing protein